MTLKVDGTNGVLQAYDYQVLTTGFSYTFASGTQTLIANPAGTLATGTITMPASPVDGMVITFSSTKQITALTLNGNTGQTITSGPTFMAAGSSASYVYNLANTAWRPLSNVPQLLNVPIGVGQTWQDLTASRAAGTTYTNSTGRPIYVNITVTTNAAGLNYGYILVDGVSTSYVGQLSGSSSNTLGAWFGSIVVPSGSTYSLQLINNISLYKWSELR